MTFDFIADIVTADGEVYVVGGTVKNIIYNTIHENKINTKDLDLVVRLITIENMDDILQNHGKTKHVGVSFSVIKFVPYLHLHDAISHTIDIAMPRTEY
jgi:hypothetical protein